MAINNCELIVTNYYKLLMIVKYPIPS